MCCLLELILPYATLLNQGSQTDTANTSYRFFSQLFLLACDWRKNYITYPPDCEFSKNCFNPFLVYTAIQIKPNYCKIFDRWEMSWFLELVRLINLFFTIKFVSIFSNFFGFANQKSKKPNNANHYIANNLTKFEKLLHRNSMIVFKFFLIYICTN